MVRTFRVGHVTTTSIALNWEPIRSLPEKQPAHWRVHWQPQQSLLVSYSAPLSADRRTFTMEALNPFTSYRVCIVPYFYAPAPPTIAPPLSFSTESAPRSRAHDISGSASRPNNQNLNQNLKPARALAVPTQTHRAAASRPRVVYQSGERRCLDARTNVPPYVLLVASVAAGVALALVGLTLYLVLSQLLAARGSRRSSSKSTSTISSTSHEEPSQCATTAESGRGEASVGARLLRVKYASERCRKIGTSTTTAASASAERSSSQLALVLLHDDPTSSSAPLSDSPSASPLATANGFSHSSSSCNNAVFSGAIR